MSRFRPSESSETQSRRFYSPITRRCWKHNRQSNSPSESSGSLGFITGIKSATVSLASASIARRQRNRSSIISGELRPSIDTQRSVVDDASRLRSRKRREKLEELIKTEESYVADLRALANVYFTLLSSSQTPDTYARFSAHKTLTAILALHDDLLADLQHIVPFVDNEQHLPKPNKASTWRSSHKRWHSVDVVPGMVQKSSSIVSPKRATLAAAINERRRSLNISSGSDESGAVLQCPPQIVASVAEIFVKHMPRFQIYEDYGANYEMYKRDIEDAQIGWLDFDRAVEALNLMINPVKSREANRKKALTPIQRLPRYELLFNDLCKLTPVCDDLEAHELIQVLLARLSETCHNMNQEADHLSETRMQEITWLIGSRLSFSDQVPRSVFLKLLGPVDMCGCLHMAFRGRSTIRGAYVISVLFDTTLMLASADDDPQRYAVLAGISLANTTIEECDNGKGLQCHTAPHSWKLVFEHVAQMYELIITACSAAEGSIWRHAISEHIEKQKAAVASGATHPVDLQSPLVADMRSCGKAFGKPGAFVRRQSVQRTATVGPTTDLNQIIIKNTQAFKDSPDNTNGSATSLNIPRSQSVATPSHVQTLAPRRADRARLEAILSDVWTKPLLPYPGMPIPRSEQLRSSTNHVIRKFSMASITSNFSSSKRSASYTSVPSARKDDRSSHSGMRGKYAASKPARLPLADLLPADFDLQESHPKKPKRSALRAFTMTMERPFSPLLKEDARPGGLKRAQSVKDATSPLKVASPKVGENSRYPPLGNPSVPVGEAASPGGSKAAQQQPQKRSETPASFRDTASKASERGNGAAGGKEKGVEGEKNRSKGKRLLRMLGH